MSRRVASGRTPRPREFGAGMARRFLDRAVRLGFEAVATGHHARIVNDGPEGRPRLLRGRDGAKDQSYVLSMLTVGELTRGLFPVGELTKHEVGLSVPRRWACRRRPSPDSQEVCFVAAGPGQGPRRR